MMKRTMLVCLFFAVLYQVAHSASITSPAERADVEAVADCQSCEYIMKFIRFQTLGRAQSTNAVKERLKDLFKIMHHSSVQYDEYLVNVEKYVKMIRDGKDLRNVCVTLTRCTTGQLELPRITECSVCTAVVDLIKFELTISNATVEIIIKAVEALCAVLGDVPVYEECKLILKELNQIIQWIEQGLAPGDICVKLGFCNSTITSSIFNYVKAQLYLQLSSGSLCGLCETVVKMVDTKLDNLDTWLTETESELNVMCTKLGDFMQQCQTDVDFVFDTMKNGLEQFEANLDPSTTCKALLLCN